jgi:hypothetical protein
MLTMRLQTTKTSATGAESPTTAREPDFDDDPHESNTLQPEHSPSPGPKRVSFQEVVDEDAPPPPKPPRPLSPQVQAENTLIEAFPSVDSKVVKAVLVASGYNVEPAFNALLSMADTPFASTAVQLIHKRHVRSRLCCRRAAASASPKARSGPAHHEPARVG